MGETVKLVNQIIIANVMIANAEALVFAQRAGADLDAVREVLASATASNYLLEQWLPKTWFAGTFEGGFALDLLRKDLAAALDAARATRLSDAGNGAWPTNSILLAPQKGTARWITARSRKSYEWIAGDETLA